ncbi:MAG TPA: alkaline phosphatase family protein [Thermoanaerobaculia bacterium]
MPHPRVLALGLDGLEMTLAERLMAAGEMPALAELAGRSARFRLDHGPAQRTGLAWEHVASGLSPDEGRRWAAVEFDPATYATWQEGARFTPWWSGLDRKVVVFDTPYVDLRRARNTRGVVGWGAHDPGIDLDACPHELLGEFEERFGAYPAPAWTYGMPFPSTARTQAMGAELVSALDLRTRAARWLATERLDDWDLFLAVAGEAHGAMEGLWHGLDTTHPHHAHPSAPAAGEALRALHRALDRMVGELVAAAGDAAVVAFTMGGMGPNHSDVSSMVLLPELLYRHAFGEPRLAVPPEWSAAPGAVPVLGESEPWAKASRAWISETPPPETESPLRAMARRLPEPVKTVLRDLRPASRERAGTVAAPASTAARQPLQWQPAARYRSSWPKMPAFALPSFYDGRIRVNLAGRERDGIVPASRYEETLRELEALLRECRNPRTGEPVVEFFERASTRDPLALSGSEADLLVIWRGVVAALEHPRLGLVGPVPLRRTGGHTGPHGMAYVASPRRSLGMEPGDRGVRSSFDVVPTLARLMDVSPASRVTGTSLI